MLVETMAAAEVLIPGRLSPMLLECAANPMRVVVSSAVLERVADCRDLMVRCLADRRLVYGANTGLGPLLGFPGRDTSVEQCDNVLDHLTVGQGPDLERAVVRATMLARLWSLSQARSGVSPEVLQTLAVLLGVPFAPVVPRLGSVGASGDLVPLAQLARAMRGEGHLAFRRTAAGAEALRRPSVAALKLDGWDAWTASDAFRRSSPPTRCPGSPSRRNLDRGRHAPRGDSGFDAEPADEPALPRRGPVRDSSIALRPRPSSITAAATRITRCRITTGDSPQRTPAHRGEMCRPYSHGSPT